MMIEFYGARILYCNTTMSPTVFYQGEYRYFFFSREEPRMHVHVTGTKGEAKFWIEPIVALARSHGLSPQELIRLQKVVEKNKNEIAHRWKKHRNR